MKTFDRPSILAGFSGLLFVGLSLVIVAMVPPLPSLNKSVAEIATYYTTHGRLFLLGNYLATFAAVPSFIFFSFLVWQIKKNEGEGWLWITVLMTTVIAHSVGAVDLIFFQMAAHLGANGLGGGQSAAAEILKMVSDLACLGFGFFFIMQGALAIYVSWAIFKTRALAPLHAWLGLLTGVFSFLASLGTVQTTGPLTIGGPVTTIGFLIFFVWIAGMSVAMIRSENFKSR